MLSAPKNPGKPTNVDQWNRLKILLRQWHIQNLTSIEQNRPQTVNLWSWDQITDNLNSSYYSPHMKNVPMDPVNRAADTAPTKFCTNLISVLGSIFSFLAASDAFRLKKIFVLSDKLLLMIYNAHIVLLTTKSGAKNCTVVQIGWCRESFCRWWKQREFSAMNEIDTNSYYHFSQSTLKK